mgnify:CR=1 FL=1
MVQKMFLGEILIQKKIITQEQLNAALVEQKRTSQILGSILLRRKVVTEKQLLEALSEQFGVSFLEIGGKYDDYFDWQLLVKFSPSLIVDNHIFPIMAKGEDITFAINNPLDLWLMDEAQRQAKDYRINMVLITKKDMDEFIMRYRKQRRTKMDKFFE